MRGQAEGCRTASARHIPGRTSLGLEEPAGLFVSGRPLSLLALTLVVGSVPVLARGDARQGGQLSPAKRGARLRELLRDCPVVLLGVQPPVLADRVAQEEVEHRPRGVAQLAIALDQGAGAKLVVLADRPVQVPEQDRGLRGLHALEVLGQGEGTFLVTPVAAVLRPAVALGDVRRGQDQAGGPVARVAQPRDVLWNMFVPRRGKVGVRRLNLARRAWRGFRYFVWSPS